MHDREQVRKRLLEERRALFRRAAKTEDDLLWLETDVEPEFQERGQEQKIVQFLDRMDTRLKGQIDAIDQALGRLSMGQYGLCESCRGDISDGGLQVLSGRIRCVACAQAREVAGAY